MKVKKYNKKIEDFDKSKIANSIKLASNATEYQTIPEFMINRIADQIENELSEKKTVTAEEISDLVENKLMQTAYKEIAKSYIIYHNEREKEHFYNSKLIKAFKNKLSAATIENSNANCDEKSFSGRMNEAARVLYKDDALNMMSKTHRDNHNNNEIYIHDLDSYSSGMSNCLSIPFDNLFETGVSIKQTDIRQPKSIGTAMQLVAVFMQIQSLQQFGGVSSTHLDWTMVPYVRYSLLKNLAEIIAYEKDVDEDKIKTIIENKLFIDNGVPYLTLSKPALDKALFNILSNTSYDFIKALDLISVSIMSQELS